MQNYTETENVVRLKKIYSTLQRAYFRANAEYGSAENWASKPPANLERWVHNGEILKNLLPFLDVAKDCKYNLSGCAPVEPYLYLKGNEIWTVENNATFYRILLNDGTTLYLVSATRPKTNPYKFANEFYVDINGIKPPNVLGKDLFGFSYTDRGFIPWGGANLQEGVFYPHDGDCANTKQTGWGCARWVIERGNQEYLHKQTKW